MWDGGFKFLAMNEKLIQVNNITLCTETFGKRENPAVLLIMGATASMLWWDAEFCQKLADKGFFVIRYDNRDTGKSTTYDPQTTNYDLMDLVDDAIGILDHYKTEKAHFVGMSLGVA
jgi:pimeloyl-ACP methyl ester carboxylesterase